MSKNPAGAEPTPPPITEQLKDLNECVATSRRAFTDLALNSFEHAVDNMVEFERAAAEATSLEWLKEAVIVRGTLINEFKDSYLRLARAVLS